LTSDAERSPPAPVAEPGAVSNLPNAAIRTQPVAGPSTRRPTRAAPAAGLLEREAPAVGGKRGQLIREATRHTEPAPDLGKDRRYVGVDLGPATWTPVRT
jgi:hypothetical protein